MNKVGYHGDVPLVGKVDNVHEGIGVLLFRFANVQGVYDIESSFDDLAAFDVLMCENDGISLCRAMGHRDHLSEYQTILSAHIGVSDVELTRRIVVDKNVP